MRLWLISEAAKVKNVQPDKVWQRISTLLPVAGQPEALVKPFCLQLLQLVCEQDPHKVGKPEQEALNQQVPSTNAAVKRAGRQSYPAAT